MLAVRLRASAPKSVVSRTELETGSHALSASNIVAGHDGRKRSALNIFKIVASETWWQTYLVTHRAKINEARESCRIEIWENQPSWWSQIPNPQDNYLDYRPTEIAEVDHG
jgi:hypothetical protein